MKPLSRQLVFRLTPLLDLLLIVIFAQFMEVRETSQAQEQTLQNRVAERLRELEAQESGLLALAEERQIAMEDAQAKLEADRESLAEFRATLEARNQQLEEELRAAMQRQEQVGDLVASFFQVPDELIETVVHQSRRSGARRSEEEIERLRKEFRELASKRGHEAIQHVLTHDELRKRCDVWSLHLAETGMVLFDPGNGERRFRFREPPDGSLTTQEQIAAAENAAADRFATHLFDIYKTGLPQTKSIVIMLFSYDPDVSVYWQRPAITGLRRAADRMRADSSGRTRFEYAVLGGMERDISTDE